MDEAANEIVLRVNYLHNNYAILVMKKENEPIYQVEFRPNPFTPSVNDISFSEARISFLMNQVYNEIEITIFNRVGEVIRNYSNIDGSNKSVIVWWDAKDDDGYEIASGIYIVKIKVDQEDPHFGAILVIK